MDGRECIAETHPNSLHHVKTNLWFADSVLFTTLFPHGQTWMLDQFLGLSAKREDKPTGNWKCAGQWAASFKPKCSVGPSWSCSDWMDGCGSMYVLEGRSAKIRITLGYRNRLDPCFPPLIYEFKTKKHLSPTKKKNSKPTAKHRKRALWLAMLFLQLMQVDCGIQAAHALGKRSPS